MKVQNISSQLKFINRIGATLSVEERISLEASILKLSQEYTYDQFNFWGRIEGVSKNYYIAEGVQFRGQTNFPMRKYFWSSEDYKFAEMPEPRREFVQQVNSMNDFFSGQHEKIIVKLGEAPRFIRGPDGEEMMIKQKNFTELDRLSLLVATVAQQCTIVPVGAYRMIPTHQLTQNPDFKGLKVSQAKKAENYVHLRMPHDQEKRILIESDKALERCDFMDSICNDTIKNSWSIQCDESGTEITVRSLVWPGYVGYHRTNSCIFGGAYMGSGIRVHDLVFLL